MAIYGNFNSTGGYTYAEPNLKFDDRLADFPCENCGEYEYLTSDDGEGVYCKACYQEEGIYYGN